MSAQKVYPFPVISQSPSEPLSSSPPHRPSIQLSAASPISTNGAALTPVLSNSNSHVHSRSHSFTPRLPSKLASPKPSLQPPTSPKRKGSASSDRIEREKNLSGGSSSSRSPFPFSLPGSGKAVSPIGAAEHTGRVPLSPTALAPPKIVEPPGADKDSKQEKRGSQLLYHSGFVNRLVDFSPSALSVRANQSYMSGGSVSALSKGWKPFKLVLKGSKLYFYKPPSDRSAAIKELFPTELVTVLEDEGLADGDLEGNEVEEEETGRGGRGRDRDDMRRRRAYWGRGTHPSLFLAGERIERGTFEALVHETIFATTFVKSTASDSVDSRTVTTLGPEQGLLPKESGDGPNTEGPALREVVTSRPSRYKPEWHEFASTVLLTLPALVGGAKFEAEFVRCCANLVSGAEDIDKDEERARVRWLATQYLTYHGNPANPESWELWRKETIPDFPADFSVTSKVAGIPKTSSTQAVFTPSPQLPTFAEFSPDFGTFSPRPGDGSKMMSIVEALGVPPPPPGQVPYHDSDSLRLRDLLESEGLTRDVLQSVDVQVLARSLLVFNIRLLGQLPDHFLADLCLEPDLLGTSESADTRNQDEKNGSSPSLAPFMGTDDSPHWLTKTILNQILIPEATGASATRTQDDRHAPTSRTHTRSEVISTWARIGELCRRTGDECSWHAIFAALCSRPVARLDKVWKRVDSDAISLVQSWVQLLEKADAVSSDIPLSVPWAGETINQMRRALNIARYGDVEEWQLSYLVDARVKFDSLRTAFALCSRKSGSDGESEAEDVEALVKQWNSLQAGGTTTGMASKFVRIDQFMSLSLAAEPRRRGLFEPYYWTRSPAQQVSQSLTAVFFPDPLPTVAFINRELLARGRLDSSASINLQEVQQIREAWLKPDATSTIRTQADKPVGIDLGGTILPVFDGELLLLVQPHAENASSSRPTSRAPSRPPSSITDSPAPEKTFSRSPSIRVSPGTSHSLDRKPSVARRNSLPSISQRTSLVVPEVSSEKPLRVVVQAGTLDRLVDILVHGLQGVSVSVSDDNGEIPLTDTKTREVKVDMDEFSEVWWSIYRSFMTPQVLFEFLRKRYLSARLSSSPSNVQINNVVRLRSEVLETMNEWINRGGGAQDALDDIQLFKSIETFLNESADHDLTRFILADDESGRRTVGLLDQIKKTLHMSFLSQSLRPTRVVSPADESTDVPGVQSFGSQVPDLDQIDVEELVNNLDSMGSAAWRNVTKEDLFVTADLLEVQSADRTGWFLPREPSAIADEVEIHSMNSYIVEVEPSTMISELAQESLYRLLPPSIRTCIRAFGILRKWLVSKLVATRVGLRVRQARMDLLLRAIEVCRLRNAEPTTSGNLSLASRPCIRSFVETVITSAILSVESRTHYRAWQNLALARGTTCDTLAALLSRPAISSLTSRGTLTVDIGWVIERMLEVISAADILESANAETSGLVNFDKRRSLHTLISTTSGISRKRQRRHLDRRDFERLNTIEKEVSSIQFDLRLIREEAYREATSAGSLGYKKPQRPFQYLVSLQQEKNKRDRHLRDRLSREKRQEQQRNDRREEYLNKAMNTRRQPAIVQKQHRNKKSMSSAFFQFMRPISSAFSSETLAMPGVKRTPAELDFVPSHKPTLVLSVVDARVAQFVNNERSFTFQLDTEDGGHYLLQTISKAEMKKWMDTVQHVSTIAAKRRLTYLGQNSKMQLSDHLLSQPGSTSRDPRAVFGVDLDFLLEREAGSGEVAPGALPSVLERLIVEVESRGLSELGIYRIAGAHSEVQAFKDTINRGEWPISSSTDIHAVCDLIKSWFRVLPGGIFQDGVYSEILEAVSNDEADLATRLSNIRRVVHGLPDSRFYLLRRIIEHLDKVTDYEENNQMTAESLSTVFSPNLLRAPNNDVALFFANMSMGHRVCKLLIAHFHTIFDIEAEQDQEAGIDREQEQEEFEFDEPIPEEDEEADMLCDGGPDTPDDDKNSLQISAGPPVLDINLGSPHSLSFTVS